jgi:hypothetical protein
MGFYTDNNLDPTDQVIYFEDSTIYCCNFDGYLLEYLRSFYGPSFVHDLAKFYVRLAASHPLALGCQNCKLKVIGDGEQLIFHLSSNDIPIRTDDYRHLLGLERPVRENSITSYVIDEYDVDSLVLEFIVKNSVLGR